MLLIAHPEHKRAAAFQGAVRRYGRAAEVVAYDDLLAGRTSLREHVRPGTVLRLESPGQNFEVERRLIARGAAVPEVEYPHASFVDADAALRLPFERGRLRYPRQWFRGFRSLLTELERDAADVPDVWWMTPPAEVARMYDKPACQQRFAAAGIPVPATLGPVGSFEELLERMRQTRRLRVFVKLAQGSSAAGTVALALGRDRVRAITTAELVWQGGELRLYNSRRIRTYESLPEVSALLDVLCREGVQVEEWVPKAALDGHAFDLRVLVIAGQARHVIARLSEGPMTNLHLLNQRRPAEVVRQRVGAESWEAALATCARAARLFPGSLHAGVDLLFTPSLRRHAVLEINAFGDLLPGTLCDGLTTHEAELAALWGEAHACSTPGD